MSLNNSLIYACLLSILQLFCNGESIYVTLKSPKELAAFSYLSPDRHGHSFAVVDFNIGFAAVENLYQVNLRIEDWEKQTFKECSFNVTSRPSITLLIDVKTLRRLIGDNEKVVISWNEVRLDVNATAWSVVRRVAAMDIDSCRSNDLGLADLTADPIVLPANDGEFDVLLPDPVRILRYNSDFQAVGRSRELDIDLDWSTARVERLQNGNYIAHGFDPRNVYQVILVDNSTGSTKKLISRLDTDKSRLKVVSNGSTICYNKNANSDTSVDCSQFNERGDLNFERPTNFVVGAATPLAVRELGLGEFFILVGDTKCTDEKSCWNLRRAKWLIHENGSMEMNFGSERFLCTGGWDNLVFYDMWRSDESMYYGYGCKQGNRYVYRVNSFLA